MPTPNRVEHLLQEKKNKKDLNFSPTIVSKSCDAVKRASVIIIGGSGSYNWLVDILRIELFPNQSVKG